MSSEVPTIDDESIIHCNKVIFTTKPIKPAHATYDEVLRATHQVIITNFAAWKKMLRHYTHVTVPPQVTGCKEVCQTQVLPAR
jgi:hypothetical protein